MNRRLLTCTLLSALCTLSQLSQATTPLPAPTLPAAGGTFYDSRDIAGSRIMRVTDAVTCPGGAINSYSYWPSFSADDSWLMLGAQGGSALVYSFDPNTFTLGAKRNLFLSRAPDNSILDWQDAIWSATDPNVIYAHANTGAKLWAYNVKNNVYTLVKDFGPALKNTPAAGGAANSYIWQMSRSVDNNVFAFTVRNLSNYAVTGYATYNVQSNTMALNTSLPGLDEVQIDKNGQYLVVKTGNQGAGVIEVQVRTVATGATVDLTDNGPDYAPGHSDNGHGIVVGADNWRNTITVRNLATPHTSSIALSMGNDWSQGFHISMLSNDESKALVSWYGEGGTNSYNNTLSFVKLDGSQNVTKLGYHYSIYNSYYDSPRADISLDGRFITFTSNWGTANGRLDVYVMALPIKGDANKDGSVDTADFDAWFNNLQTHTNLDTKGDFNGDGFVDTADFDIWFDNLQLTLNGPQSFAGLTPAELAEISPFLTAEQLASLPLVPEPGTLPLLALATLALLRRRRA